jgi:uncharacterized membrane protein
MIFVSPFDILLLWFDASLSLSLQGQSSMAKGVSSGGSVAGLRTDDRAWNGSTKTATTATSDIKL